MQGAPAAAPTSGAPAASKPPLAAASNPFAASSNPFAFGSKPVADAEAGKDKGKEGAPAPIFSFGAPAAAEAPRPAGASPFGSFSFGAASTAAAPAVGGDGEGEGDGEDADAGPPEEVVLAEKNTEDTAERLFECKSKLMFKGADDLWNEVGTGQAIIQRVGEACSLVFRNESTGKVVVNSPIYKGIKPMIGQGKPKMVILTVYFGSGRSTTACHAF